MEPARDELLALVYELLDAHDDTSRLADGLTDDLRWRVHLDYLRDLQRAGRELLARTSGASGTDLDDVALQAARAAVARALRQR